MKLTSCLTRPITKQIKANVVKKVQTQDQIKTKPNQTKPQAKLAHQTKPSRNTPDKTKSNQTRSKKTK